MIGVRLSRPAQEARLAMVGRRRRLEEGLRLLDQVRAALLAVLPMRAGAMLDPQTERLERTAMAIAGQIYLN